MNSTISFWKVANGRQFLFLFFLLPGLALAGSYRNETINNFDQLVPVSIPAPPKPETRFGPGPEGWIKIRFSVNADGTTSEIEVLDFMPSSFSRRDAIRAVESWTFEPAMADEAATDWHNNIVVINFDLDEIPNISGPQFTGPYGEVDELIKEERLDRAATRATRNLRQATFTMHDIGMGNMQLAIVEMRLQDMHLAHQAITRATLREVTQLSNEELDVGLQYRFNIELALGRYADALDTFERRNALADIPDDDIMHEQVAQIHQALDGEFTLNAMGKIIDKDMGWFFIPSRRTFTIANVDGDVDSIEAVCNRRKISLEYQPEVEWTLPESWGDCSVNVMGKRDTTFTFYEFADQ